MKRILLLILFVSPFISAAQKDNQFDIDILGSHKSAKIQIVHNAPDPELNIVDIYLDTEKILDDFEFRKATTYIEIEAEIDSKLAIAPSNSSSVNDAIKTFDFNLASNENYLAMIIGVIDAAGFQPGPGVTDIILDLVLSPGKRETSNNPTMAEVIIANGSIDLPVSNLKSRKDGTAIATNMSYKDVTSYVELFPTDQLVDLSKSSDPEIVQAAFLAEVGDESGNAFTVFGSGFVMPELNKNGPSFGFYAVTADGSVSIVLEIKSARVQIIHNISDPSLEMVDVYRKTKGQWELLTEDLKFRTGTAYFNVPPAEDFLIAIAPGNSSSVSDTLKMFSPHKFIVGNREIMVLQGVNNSSNFVVNPNSRDIELGLKRLGPANGANGDVEMFFLHGATDVQGIDVLNLGYDPIADGLKYFDASNSTKLPGQYAVFVLRDENDDNDILSTLGFDFSQVASETVTVLTSGFKTPENNQNGASMELVLIDSMGLSFLFEVPDLLPPTNLKTIAVNQEMIDLSWVDNEPDANEFVLEKSMNMDFSNKTVINIDTDVTTYSDTDVTKLITYFYRIKAVKSASTDSGYSNVIEVLIPDFVAAPAELTANSKGTGEILLNWTDKSDNETRFVLDRSLNENMSDSVIIGIAMNVESYTDKNLDKNTKYFYRIRAVNENTSSDYSNMANATTDDFVESPTKLEALGVTSSTIILAWEDNSDNEDGFLLIRSLAGDFNNADTIEIKKDIDSYTDQDLEKNTKYFYKIKAFNSNVDSEYSATIDALTNDALSSPSELVATPMSPIQIDIGWKDNADDEDKFVLERSLNKNDFSGATLIDIDKDAISYSDNGLVTGNTYWYRVKAIKGELSSSYSNLDSAAIGIYTALADELSSAYKIYPNPSLGSSVFLKLDKKFSRSIDLNIFSYSGKLVKHYSDLRQKSNLEIEIDLLEIETGVYIVEVIAEDISHIKLIRGK